MSEGNGKYATHFSVKKYFTSNEVVAVKGGGVIIPLKASGSTA